MNFIRQWIKLVEGESSPAKEMIDVFEEAFEKSGLKDHVYVSLWHRTDQAPDEAELSGIGTERESRGKGYGNKAMTLICRFADQYQITLTLGIAEDADGENDSLTRDQLHLWYTGWGFEGGMSMKHYPDEPWTDNDG